MTRVKTFIARLWRQDALLTAVGLLMGVALVASLAGLWLDPRTIGGAPAWLKPAKFAASIGVYALTLAWVFGYLPAWERTRRIVGRATAAVLVLEVVIIDAQAWRGTTSHFNVGTPLDIALFATMGLAIVLQTLASVAVAVALWRQAFADRAFGWTLRLGMSITIIGAATGGLMTRPTEAQLTEARATHHMTISGSHTVGAPDGGPGLPGTGWSVQHGDVRVPHFLGLHALQALPLMLLIFARETERKRVRLIMVAAASYVSLFGILLWQALRGQSVINPDPATMAALATWLLVTIAAIWMVTSRRELLRTHAMVC